MILKKTAKGIANRNNRFYYWICVLILLGASFISMSQMQDSLYPDERITISHLGNLTSHYSLWDTTLSVRDNSPQHAPVYFWLLNISSRVTGYSPVALRYPSILFGILSLALTFAVTRRYYGQQAALYATGLAGASAINLYYFHEMRMYTLATFMVLLLMWQYGRFIRETYQPSWPDRLLLFATVTATIYTQYFTIIPLVGFGIYHLLFVKKNRRWVEVSAIFILGGVLFLPWLPVVLAGTGEVAGTDLNPLASHELLYVWLWLIGNALIPLMIVAAGGLILGLADRRIMLPVILSITVCCGLLVLNGILGFMPLRRSRYFLLLLPYPLMLMGYGLARLPRWHFVMPVVLIVWFASAYQLHYSTTFERPTNREFYHFEDFPPFTEITSAFITHPAIETPDDLVLMVSMTPEWEGERALPYIAEYYWRQIHVAGRVIEAWTFSDRASVESPQDYRRVVDYELSLNPLVVYLGYEPDKLNTEDYNQMVTRLVDVEGYRQCDPLTQTSDVYLESFVRHPAPCEIISPPNLDIGYDARPLRLRQLVMEQLDEQLAVVTAWALEGEMALDEHSYSLRVVNQASDYIAMSDQGIPLALNAAGEPDGVLRRDMALLDTSNWQSGEYELRLVAYRRASADIEPLIVEGTDTVEATLATFNFER